MAFILLCLFRLRGNGDNDLRFGKRILVVEGVRVLTRVVLVLAEDQLLFHLNGVPQRDHTRGRAGRIAEACLDLDRGALGEHRAEVDGIKVGKTDKIQLGKRSITLQVTNTGALAGKTPGNTGSGAETTELTGVIDNIASAVVDQNSVYYIIIRDMNAIYKANVSVSDILPFLKVGDTVTFKVDNSGRITEISFQAP